ncbi:hypothetical protein JOB18_027037 [Solea senegalensis]|uniref:Uncharacterized protein n=1 Tax=Solea senegalensis TaxID=28829 RepID=A0AAV6Q8D9_SOLSE|nr:hypothetical protein JOB18_027037 [Solea senegalensis]
MCNICTRETQTNLLPRSLISDSSFTCISTLRGSCVVKRCAVTRGDLCGSPTQSFGLVRHPQPELQQFTRSPKSPRGNNLSSVSMVQ